MNRFFKTTTAAFLSLGLTTAALANEVEFEAQEWSFSGMFGKFDLQAAQRGFQVYTEVCASCHSIRFVAYRNLTTLGYNEAQIKAYAAEFEVEDGPDDEGEMFMRPATPADRFVPPFPNKKAAAAANGGTAPPDLSLMTKARKKGPDYIYALLNGYRDTPAEEWLAEYEEENGKVFNQSDSANFNEIFRGFQIAMAPPLFDDAVEYADGTPATVDQMSRDVIQFLAWTAEPELQDRKEMGLKVMIYLVVLLVLFIYVKRKVWAKLH